MHLLKKVANLLDKILSLVCSRVGYAGTGVIMAMVLLIVADITLRRFFNRPLPFSYELVGALLVVIVYCSVPYTTSTGRHVSIEVLVSRFPPKVRTNIDAGTDFLCAVLFGLIAWQSIVRAIHFWDIGQRTGILKIPYYPFVLVVAIGCILASLALLVKFARFITGGARE